MDTDHIWRLQENMENLYMEREGEKRFYENVSSICYEEYMKRTVQFSENIKNVPVRRIHT